MKDLNLIVPLLNKALETTALSDFYALRNRINGGIIWKSGVLDYVRADRDLDGYAFHKGGRSELQFNVGFEDGGYFRYGVAFSLEANRNLVDPVSVLLPKILAFNAAVGDFPVLRTLHMWRYEAGERTRDAEVAPVPQSAIRPNVFIFIGERVPVGAEGVTPAIIARAAQVMASLLPLYERVETTAALPAPSNAFKVARLCWNTNDWQSPTGRIGKVGNKKAFEGEYGFGHEEWVLDHSRLLDGWKYGFIQALNHSFQKYAGTTIDLLLYTIDNKSKRRYWVASIAQAQVLTEQEAKQANRTFEKNGWLDEMREQVRMQGLDDDTLTVETPQELLNFRYRPESLTRFDPMVEFPAKDLPAAYYGTFLGLPGSQAAIVQGAISVDALKERNIDALTSTRTTKADERVVDLTHKRWQRELRASLKETLPHAEIYVETRVDGHWVDIVIKVGGKTIFVELKTCTVVRQAIREALSQLLEYAYRPPAAPRCDVLLIVCAGISDPADEQYMQSLRDRFHIPVHYLPYRDRSILGIKAFVDSVVANK